MLSPENRTVMITGANRGIGRAIADHLSTQGYQLSLGVRDTASLDTAMFPGDTIIQRYDAVDPDTAGQWTTKTIEHFGSVDALVLNAGVMKSVGVTDGDEDELDMMWEVNFKGPLRLVRAALPSLKACGHGRVINVVSLSGKRVLSANNLGYCASKFAAQALTHALRQEGWSNGLRATSVCPGLVDTDMVSTVTTPEDQFKISPDTIAATASYALSLPNEASVAEILVNSRLESML